MPRKAKAKQAANSLIFTDEENRPTYKLKTGEVVPMSDKRIAAMKRNAWDKGESGNPEGRPPLPEELREKIAYMTPDAIDKVYELMNTSDNAMVQLKAAELLIGSQISKAASKQEINHTISGNVKIETFLKDITEDFERDPSLLIDVTPNKPENPKAP